MFINLKYELNYGNISGDQYKCQFFKVGAYNGEVIELDGYCIHEYKSVQSIFEPIRGSSLTINFIANLEQSFDDLTIVEEFKFIVLFYKNDVNIFTGWLLPEGIQQSYVNESWEVSLKAVDGLGFLKNYEYQPKTNVILPNNSLVTVNNVYPQEFGILYTILNRLTYTLPIATFDEINQGFSLSTGVPVNYFDFANINKRIINKEVFLNKNGNYLDCETILKDILQKYNFIIFQGNVNGQLAWIITRPFFQLTASNQKGSLFRPSSVIDNKIIFERFETFNNQSDTIFSNYDTDNGLIHCNQNQIINYNAAIQNFRFDQKWLGLKNYGVSLTDSNYDVTSRGFFVSEGIRSDIKGADLEPAATQTTVISYNKDFQTNIIIEINTLFRVTLTDQTLTTTAWMNYRVKAVNTINSEVLYLRINSEGQSEWGGNSFIIKTGQANLTGSGSVFVNTKIEAPELNNFNIFVDIYEYDFIDLRPVEAITTDIKIFFRPISLGIGEYHDTKSTNQRSSFLSEPVKVINSNQNDDVYLNNLYEVVAGDLEPQDFWQYRNTSPTYQNLLELTARERLRMLSKPQMIFSGDVYGYLPYFNKIIYDKIEGQFLITAYSFNSKTNITRLECSQAFIDSINQDYEQTFYFDDEKNVLIKEN